MYQYNTELKKYNSFQTEAKAKVFCEPENMDQLKTCLVEHRNESKLIIGKGCNLFFTKDYDGLVIKLKMFGIREISDKDDDSEQVFLEVMASEDWDSFVHFCVERGYAGLENLSYIPGTVGASPIQNIGAYGAEVKDCIREVVALDTETMEVVSFANAECEFSYRDSIFKRTNRYIVISVVFLLNRSYTYQPKYADLTNELQAIESPSILEVRDAIIRIRQRKLPDEKTLPNSGSFFKNPYITKQLATKISSIYPDLPIYATDGDLIKTSAAFLIDRAGFKGKQIGQIGTYPKQALIIVNYGSPNGKDIVSFMQLIQKAVFDLFEIQLEPEVRIL
ncbi:MAG: UDP-N-acetylmuramate dehydrogenase [Bacteroidota bacterium]|jgi:UDP-N-acetylmuramate dehydrogenase